MGHRFASFARRLFGCSGRGRSAVQVIPRRRHGKALVVVLAVAVGVSIMSGPAGAQSGESASGAPTNVRVVAEGRGSVTVAWDAPVPEEGRPPPRGYRVFYRLAASEPGTDPEVTSGWYHPIWDSVGAGVRQDRVTGLRNGKWYEFRVEAIGGYWSDESVFARPGAGLGGDRLPGRPAEAVIEHTGLGSLTVRWDPPADDGGSAVTGYEVWYVVGDDRSVWDVPWVRSGGTLGAEVREHVISGLADYRSYVVVVAAVNDAGRGPISRDLWGVAGGDALEPPPAPTNVRLVGEGDRSVTLAWDPPETGEGQAQPPGYTVYYSQVSVEPGSAPRHTVGEQIPVEFGAGANGGTISELTNAAWYEFRVQSRNGSWSQKVLLARPGAAPEDARLPGVPAGLRVVAERSGSVTVAWDPPTDDGGSPVTGYEVWYSSADDRRLDHKWVLSEGNLGSDTRSHSVSGLIDYQDYLVIVAAVNDEGRGAFAEKRATANLEDLDLLGLIVGHRSTRTYSVDVDTWEVWVCDVPDGTTEVDLASTVVLLNREITRYFGWLSGGRYQPKFIEGGTVAGDTDVASVNPGDYGCEEPVREASAGGSQGAVIILDKADLEGAHAGSGPSDEVLFPENGRVAVVPPWAVLPASEFCRGSRTFGNCEYPNHVKLDWVAHEMAHAIAWPHSFGGRQIVEGKVYAGDNPMDLMSDNPEAPELGLNALAVGTTAVNRYAAGWIEPEDVTVHLEPYATYLLSPPSHDGVQMLVLPTGQPGRFISLGARLAQGHDAGIPAEGVEVYHIDQRAAACAKGDAIPPDPDRLLCRGTDRRTQPVPPAEPETRSIEELVRHVYGPGDGLTIEGFRVEVTEQVGDRYRVWVGNPYRGTFADDERNTHERNINKIAELGITTGCNPELKLYCPDQPVTRAQMAVFLIRALNERTGRVEGSRFTDVESDARHGPYIERLAELEITVGFGDGTFRPDDPVTRGQMAVFLTRAFDGLSPVDNPTGVFDDVPPTASYAAAAEGIRAAGITQGCSKTPGHNYCPDQHIRRDQIATFLTRAIETTR